MSDLAVSDLAEGILIGIVIGILGTFVLIMGLLDWYGGRPSSSRKGE